MFGNMLTLGKGIGDFANIETTPECTFITFKDRFTAEKFMYGTSNGEIPSAGKIELAWVQTPVDLSTSSLSVSKMEKQDEMKLGEGDATMQISTPTHGDGQRQEHHQDLDYDVADDNDWGIS
jgi:RNA-binding protein 26